LYRISLDDTHPNPLGYKIIAENLYKEIINDK
jgi:lysophospholipase L1-like esterase